MKDCKEFGTRANPLRASKLPLLNKCSWSYAMIALSVNDDRSGPAADTGSAAHAAVEAWHLSGQDSAVAIAAMRELAPVKFPLADLKQAEKFFRSYTADPRNSKAEIVLLEEQVELTLDPHFMDSTGQPILIHGTLDQVRRQNAQLVLTDLKTGGMLRGHQMVHEHALQLIVYQLGAEKVLGERVPQAQVLRVQDYERGGPVFHACPWRRSDVELLLDGIRLHTAMVRMGRAYPNPGGHCDWCPARGLGGCLTILKEVRSAQSEAAARTLGV